MSKYIFVTSGVCSSLGKGVATSSIGSLLECAGLKIAMMKCDPYINMDAGTISPYQRGEVYVTQDGAEADMDLGNYSRFTSVNLTSGDCLTTGKVYSQVIKNERQGLYNGHTVQVIPHITDEIKRCIKAVGQNHKADVVLVEIGGTVGDIESIPFLEATRQLVREEGHNNCLCIHITLVPIITGGELKSKPTQHAVKQLQEAGIQPDILLCRCNVPLDCDIRKKIALFCNVTQDSVFVSCDVQKSIYEIPVIFNTQGLDEKILRHLGFENKKANIKPWTNFLGKLNNTTCKLCIAIVGNKDYLEDCYKSVRESLFHAAVGGFDCAIEIRKIDTEVLEHTKDIDALFAHVEGVVIPGSYGSRGFLGMVQAVNYARKHSIAFLGIDIGMHIMAIEAARNILGWQDADSTQFIQSSTHPIISSPEEQHGAARNMIKLGTSTVRLLKNSKLYKVYNNTEIISERHCNKYCLDKCYQKDLEEANLLISATSTEDDQAEAIEWTDSWGVGVQYHPEFTSQPFAPHPLFLAFVRAALHR